MTLDEFGSVTKAFYAEFGWPGESEQERSEMYLRHYRALSDLPVQAVEVAVNEIIATWTDEKRRPRIGKVRDIAVAWWTARLKATNAKTEAKSDACPRCNAVVGLRRGSESRRLHTQHEPHCPHFDDVQVDPVPQSDEPWQVTFERLAEANPTHR